MTGCLHLIHSVKGFDACRLRAGPQDTLVLMVPSALPASLPPIPAGAAQPALHWLDPGIPSAGPPVDPVITAIDIQELVRLTEQYRRIVTWD